MRRRALISPPEQLLEELNGQVLLRHALHLGQELVRENRDVGLLEPGGREDVHDAFGGDRAGDDLAHGVIEVLFGPRVAWRTLGEHRLHRLEEGHVVTDAQSLFVRHRQGKRLRQLAHGAHESFLAVLLFEDVLLSGGQQA